jgi:alpha-L-fucosidase
MTTHPRISLVLTTLCLLAFVASPSLSHAQAKRDAGYDQRMAWFRDARFGMFIHFGLYSQAAGEWDGKPVGFVEYFGFRNTDDWQTLVNDFNPTAFDADKIVLAAKNAGMKYLIVTSKHHDGFCLFDSRHTEFDVMSTPLKRDIIGELAEACRKHGLRFGFYYSIIDLHHPDYLPRYAFDTRPADDADFDRYIDFMKAQLRELLTNYGPIDVVWFDGEWDSTWTHEHAKDMWDYLREIDPNVLINNRIDKGRAGMQGLNTADHYLGDYGTPEQQLLERQDWETCQTMNRHGNWGWRRDESDFYSESELIQQVVTCASLGGNMLLNIGPKNDGSIPETQSTRLAAIGKWMRTNGSSIYSSTASPFSQPPAWGRTTTKDKTLYCHIFERPASGVLVLPPVEQRPLKAWRLGDAEQVALKIHPRDDGGLEIELSGVDLSLETPVIAIEFDEQPTSPPLQAEAEVSN